jgi:hypothetical protein
MANRNDFALCKASFAKPYPSDLSDTEWAILEPVLLRPFSVGAPRKTDFREVVNALPFTSAPASMQTALQARADRAEG